MDFQFHIPVEILEKSLGGTTKRIIAGICSTDDLDAQQERILQEGLDFEPFLKSGWFNDNHCQDTGGAVGVPTRAELKNLPNGRKGWYVEGELLDTPRAQSIFDLAKSLQQKGNGRKLGFSVEGGILERDPTDPRQVRKAVVREVAVTRCPVNGSTELPLLAKSLSVGSSPAPANTPLTGENAASVLAPESLERKKTKDEEDEEKKKQKKMTKAEAFDLLRRQNIPEPIARLAIAIASQPKEDCHA